MSKNIVISSGNAAIINTALAAAKYQIQCPDVGLNQTVVAEIEKAQAILNSQQEFIGIFQPVNTCKGNTR